MKIKSIILDMNGKSTEISIKDAEALYRELDGIFGKESIYPVYISRPAPVLPVQWTLEVDPNAEPYPDHWSVCSDNKLRINV